MPSAHRKTAARTPSNRPPSWLRLPKPRFTGAGEISVIQREDGSQEVSSGMAYRLSPAISCGCVTDE